MTTLEALRIFGPCDAFEIQARTKAPLDAVVDSLWSLYQRGFACNPSGYAWDVTELGRQAFTKRLSVRRDEARACVGRAS